MRYSEVRISLRPSSFFYTVAFLVLIAILSTTDSNILLPLPTISQIALAADATVTKIQLPGIIPNNNNPSSDFSVTSNACSNNNINSPPPPSLTHNTRARPTIK
jgi:hypothetical protein